MFLSQFKKEIGAHHNSLLISYQQILLGELKFQMLKM